MMRIDGDSLSSAPLVPDDRLCGWCHARLRFHSPYAASRHASLLESLVARSTVVRAASERAIQRAARADVGSSSTRRGAGASRSWSVTGSSGLACRRLRLAKSGSTSGRGRSARGQVGGKILASSKSSTEEDAIIGTEVPTPADIGEMGARFWAKVDLDGPWVPYMDTPCWVWTAHTDKDGYGRFKIKVDGKWTIRPAHAVAFFFAEGRLGKPMVLHRCDNRLCVRRDHLFEGDADDNAKDMSRKGRARNQDQEECVNGHPFDEANTYWRSETRRMCRACDRERKQAARTGRTSGSSKWLPGVDDTTGPVEVTLVEYLSLIRKRPTWGRSNETEDRDAEG